MAQIAQREQAHRLIDVVSQEQLAAEVIGTEEKAQAAAALGAMYPMAEVMAELGITPADLEIQRQDDEIASLPR